MWNPFKRKKTTPETAASTAPVSSENKAKKKESIEERLEKELDALPAIFKNKLKDPQVKQRFIDIAKRMEKDGVDFKSIRQMKKWMKEHEAELKAEQAGNMPKVETVVHDGPRIGRNDPCPCGSGKKYKKCCGKDL
ncbi:MAG: SEC-C domain-containing protein [Elusimicrobiaceae bacterium]|nr:SEC-C domain-containing protein [Elusimicrobiaceae bacterium]